ncbi:MAG TPA: tRNA epoxyqueuosine(34) reductase QueG [Caulobacteraceae bacterium]|nr:tRNA epoxyqueuosine(34) reductase QueG [Caulobacteraceae bacterium]
MTTSTSKQPRADPRASIRDRAAKLGFDVLGFADAAAPWPAAARLARFLEEGRHGTMEWMARTAEPRAHPTALWPKARTALVAGMNYGPDRDPLQILKAPELGAISVYAQGRDYHDVIKGRLKDLAGFVAREVGGEVKVFVDTAPVMEKPLAQRAGLGWQGKHTNLVSRRFGSWLFLGVVLASARLKPDAAEADHCGACRACLDVCPTDALAEPYRLDARACISYLTIEHAGPVPERYRGALANRIFGCDDCLAVCPWNKFASRARETKLAGRQAVRSRPLAELAALTDPEFRALFAGGPVRRIGRDRFVRNVLYAIGNSGRPKLASAARARLDDRSEVVRDAAGWALERLGGRPAQAPREPVR